MQPKLWLKQTNRSVTAWAREIGVARQTAQRYLAGAVPTADVLDRIETLSGGQVTANDFHRLRRYRATKAEIEPERVGAE